MTKCIATLIAILLLPLAVHTAFAQDPSIPLTEREWGIYYQLVDKLSGVDYENVEAHSRALKKAADEMGLDIEFLGKIELVGKVSPPNEQENMIFQDILKRVDPLPDDVSETQLEPVYSQVARDYGFSLARVYDILKRCQENTY